jgi:hypothetical protein
MRATLFLCLLLLTNTLWGQQGLIPLHTFYRDHLFANKNSTPFNNGSFLPASEADYDLIRAINDSVPQYYDFTHVLFQKYLFELKGEDYYLKISPAIDFTYGRDLNDTILRTLFQNTRGLHVEGNLFKNFAFSTSIYENQGRFTNYETAYYRKLGEMYPQASGYQTQNAVIPGGGRTKEFKGDGFDYAFAVGYFVYQPWKWLRVRAGNNMQFIGDGYRSVLLSDNSYSAPYVRLDWKISEKFSFTYHRARLMNLMRRPLTGSVEAYYEAKGYSVNYFTYMPTKNIHISLFESGMWNRGDSLESRSAHPLFYNPVPAVSGLVLKGKNEVSTLLGINAGLQLGKNHHLYAQFGLNDFNVKKTMGQIGYRVYNLFKLKDLMLQAEYNYVAPNAYQVDNRRLNQVHYNLPLAHPKGDGLHEFVFRGTYEFKRVYLELTSIYYSLFFHSSESLLPVDRPFQKTSGTVLYEQAELGYRFNRKMNLCLFIDWRYRQASDEERATQAISIGLRTAFINHYRDF